MPKSTPKSIFRHGTFNTEALCALATKYRNGVPCSCDLAQHPMNGSFNWAITVHFEDSIEWIMRSPRSGYDQFSNEISGRLLSSEAATLNASSDNPIGVPYILMSKAQGMSLQEFWKINPSMDGLTLTKKAKVMSQLDEITWKLAQVRFDRIGSLFEGDSEA
ncbi:Aminoglycoside phosphotransferase [Penicillium malachiteum]|uniref:Aminoglycoside phosphotransferase n=1 Tax=Penicillium malachiteum TaxID=1324776 RepID=UPI002547A8BB|nr:Aminoglycoside phosphotransferase [Penicillium malachiteum]KAJ5731683.1 Aminoglycoside phosphotransferase [Penicillium malachiteum]